VGGGGPEVAGRARLVVKRRRATDHPIGQPAPGQSWS